MRVSRRVLNTGPHPKTALLPAVATAVAPARRPLVLAAQADLPATELPGIHLPDLDELRQRGVLGTR
ncbi:hypothetical protein ABT160_27330 [Streptomyces sp. NPDC001941]|uniref:hypothetical protein n=1 Tax=Streptomyces sp. NPDC001941 TaxID=3154659 RepID=UPI003329FBBD